MDDLILENRKNFLSELETAFPDRKDESKGYPDIVVNAEENLDELIRMTVEKKSWFLYGVDKNSRGKVEKTKERKRSFSLSYPLPK